MDGADSIDSEVVNQILFKGFWITAPVEELIPNQLYQGYLSLRSACNLQRIKANQSSLSLKRGIGYDIIKGAIRFLGNIRCCFLGYLWFSFDLGFIDHSLAYLQCLRVRGVGLNDVNIFPAYFSGNLGVDGCFVADEAEDGIGWVFRELADELELDDGIFY